jgi:hypothetical protein
MKNFQRRTKKIEPIRFYPVISADEAKRQGTPASVLRTISRSLERIGRNGYEGGAIFLYDGEGYPVEGHVPTEPAYDRRQTFHSARELRLTAKEMDRN